MFLTKVAMTSSSVTATRSAIQIQDCATGVFRPASPAPDAARHRRLAIRAEWIAFVTTESTACPVCSADLEVDAIELGEILICPNCGAEMEARKRDPWKFELLPEDD